MASWGSAEREAGKVLHGLDTDDLHDQLDTIRGHLQELSHAFNRSAHHRLGRARELASATAHDAEETMQDHLAASMLLALGLGVLVGYLIRRGA